MDQQFSKIFWVIISISPLLASIFIISESHAQLLPPIPSVNDRNLRVEPVFSGLNYPTSIAFLGPNDLLVLDKDNGLVQRIVDGQLMPQPLLDINAFYSGEGGLLGLETTKSNNGTVYVFLYYTEALLEDEKDDQKKSFGNRLYRYELINNTLVKPQLLLSLPSNIWHNGGAITVGPDGNLYIPVGDVRLNISNGTLVQNIRNGSRPDLSGGILRMTQNGKQVGGIIGDSFPESLYFAYGIRSSFGIDFDPVTGNMWDTENGPAFGDEINIVTPGFNSGWSQVQGIWQPRQALMGAHFDNISSLVTFGGKGKYAPPQFIWQYSVGPTAIKFLATPKLGSQYENDIFVGDIVNGRLYHFNLNKDRTGLQLNGSLSDKLANKPEELAPVIFGENFRGISDLEVGPDGHLYVVSPTDDYFHLHNPPSTFIDEVMPGIKEGAIYRIVPKTALTESYNYSLNPQDNVLNQKIIRYNTDSPILRDITVPSTIDKNRIVLKENNTLWSDTLQQNAYCQFCSNTTSIEGNFRIISEENKDKHAGLTWRDGNKTYYLFVRFPEITIANSVGEIGSAYLDSAYKKDWNNIMIISSNESIYVYHDGILRIKVPREPNGADISRVGIKSFNTDAAFGPLRIGQFPQNLSQDLLPDMNVTVNGNGTFWSDPFVQNATSIEGSFRIIHDVNETNKDKYTGLTWKEGNGRIYSVFLHPNKETLSLFTNQSELLNLNIGHDIDQQYKLKVAYSTNGINIYLDDVRKIQVPIANGTNISSVGIVSNNTDAIFDPIKIGWDYKNVYRK